MIERKPAAIPAPNLARHVAIIMDGNRGWARERNVAEIEGQRAGARALSATAQAAGTHGIEILSAVAFCEENWAAFARDERDALAAANVRVRTIGRLDRISAATREAIETLCAATSENRGLLLNLAVDYGARTELGDAMRALARDVRRGALALDAIDDETLGRYLYTADLPDPDLLIRTGGGLRLSNFLLYQLAYTELWSTPVLWPNFDDRTLAQALGFFATRQRRFGT
jgi:undecaprenyl diphosphate synthase